MEKFISEITGHLDIIIQDNQDEFEGTISNWREVLIHGDSEGLRSFAKLLTTIADLNQQKVEGLPIGAREHIHLRPELELSSSSVEVIVGRLDANGSGKFYYIGLLNKIKTLRQTIRVRNTN